MDCGDASPARHGSPSPPSPASTPSPQRRYSMDEDLYYRHVMTEPPCRPQHPPPYQAISDNSGPAHQHGRDGSNYKRSVSDSHFVDRPLQHSDYDRSEPLPNYQSTVSIEGVFSKKHEIENTTKRAVDRHWHTVHVSLNGTALNVYTVKKDWGWGKTRDGPTISPDNPPWVKKSKLEKSYSLLHADAGIAADYTKRRYVIRIRAETDQFLLSCIELSTFVKWLECLFAAIDVAAPIDDRDFPRDMSIPRVQRLRWFHGQSPALPGVVSAASDGQTHEATAEGAAEELTSTTPPQQPQGSRLESQAAPSRTPARFGLLGQGQPRSQSQPGDSSRGPLRPSPQRRLSITNYPNSSVDPHTGKWFPEHRWSSAHDLLYAKLCYSNLLFRSPRKSNYIISKGKQWFVDWKTGRMVRVLPPTYGEIDYFGPWQVIHTENVRI
ncbi:hypothetical protein CDD81_1350 [Ophiocordyceps australis]|uniref:PH domain-containing protein n=1 Tax=Ophiocordyceps australis TaxID=1399860 RepID=A0A2C5Y123_9HYPO|nr:hypothetical protein CDD81_1350 [Ophiocordyceps australis]